METMEAKKETVENLISNSSKTIEEFYSRVWEDVQRLKRCDDETPVILRLTLELRRDMRFTMLDLLTGLRSCLRGTHYVEKCFLIMHMEGTRVEGYDLLRGFGKTEAYTIWTRLGTALHERNKGEDTPEVLKAYESIEILYDKITSFFDTIKASNEERIGRNLTYHYDSELLKVYDLLIKVQKTGEDDPVRRVTSWMDMLLWIQLLCDSIVMVEAEKGNILPEVTPNPYRMGTLCLSLYKRMAGEFGKEDKLQEVLGFALDQVSNVDWVALQEKRLLRVQDWLAEKEPEQEPSKMVCDMVDVMNVILLVRIFFADIATVIRGFVNAGSDVEFPLILRKLCITKVSALSHLVGYDEEEASVSLWPQVIASLPDGANEYKDEALLIGEELKALVIGDDIKTRGLYIHLIDRYSHKSSVPQIISNIEGLELMKEIPGISKLIKALGHARKFLDKWFVELVSRVKKQTDEKNTKWKAQINDFRKLVNNTIRSADFKKSFNESFDKLEGVLEI